MKLTPEQAAAKAFRDCRSDSDQSRKVASFLAKQHLVASGATQDEAAAAMTEINEKLDQMFAQRKGGEQEVPSRRLASPIAKPTASDRQNEADAK